MTNELWDAEGKQRSLDNVRRTSLANVDKIADSAVDKTANEPDYIVHEETRKDLDLLNAQSLTKNIEFSEKKSINLTKLIFERKLSCNHYDFYYHRKFIDLPNKFLTFSQILSVLR